MRIILSEGQVNIFNLAKNAGTSVDQIERFYARNLPLLKEMAINLQSFGSGKGNDHSYRRDDVGDKRQKVELPPLAPPSGLVLLFLSSFRINNSSLATAMARKS